MTDAFEPFDPEDMAELTARFDSLVEASEQEYIVQFRINKLGAKELIKEWFEAILGVEEAVKNSFAEYSYIMNELMNQMQQDPDLPRD